MEETLLLQDVCAPLMCVRLMAFVWLSLRGLTCGYVTSSFTSWYLSGIMQRRPSERKLNSHRQTMGHVFPRIIYFSALDLKNHRP